MKTCLRILVAAVVILAAMQAANAALYTTITDTAQMNGTVGISPPVGPPVPFSEVTSAGVSSGRTFTNQLGPGGGVLVGDEIKTVGATPINTVVYGQILGNLSGLTNVPRTTAGKQYIAVFAIDGNVVLPGSTPAGRFTSGRVMLTEVTPGTFNRNDPTTWGFSTSSLFAEWVLKPDTANPETIISGLFNPTPGSFPQQVGTYVGGPTGVVNLSSVNLTTGQLTDGLFLFLEDTANGKKNLFDSDSTQASKFTTAPQPNEDLIVKSEQTIVGLTQGNVESGTPLTAAQQAMLDAIMTWGTGKVFANWASGGNDNFIVTLSGGNVTVGAGGVDFISDQGVDAIPGLEVIIPEPASVVIWSTLLVGACFISRRKWSVASK
jgi:hypothetical protein